MKRRSLLKLLGLAAPLAAASAALGLSKASDPVEAEIDWSAAREGLEEAVARLEQETGWEKTWSPQTLDKGTST